MRCRIIASCHNCPCRYCTFKNVTSLQYQLAWFEYFVARETRKMTNLTRVLHEKRVKRDSLCHSPIIIGNKCGIQYWVWLTLPTKTFSTKSPVCLHLRNYMLHYDILYIFRRPIRQVIGVNRALALKARCTECVVLQSVSLSFTWVFAFFWCIVLPCQYPVQYKNAMQRVPFKVKMAKL